MFCTKTHIKGFWVIFFYSIASLVSDVFLSSSEWASSHKFFMWNIFTIVEYILLSYFFYLTITQRSIRLLIVVISIIYFILFIVLNKSIHDQFNSFLSFVSQVIILILCLVYFISSTKHNTESLDILNPLFLVVFALLLYVASTLFLFIIANHLSESELNKYWRITNFSNILMNLLFSAAFVLYRVQNKKRPYENRPVDFTSPNDR